jgi:hypothetical protein
VRRRGGGDWHMAKSTLLEVRFQNNVAEGKIQKLGKTGFSCENYGNFKQGKTDIPSNSFYHTSAYFTF